MATESKKHTHPTLNVSGADTLADKASEALHSAEEKASEAAEAVVGKAHEVMGDDTPAGQRREHDRPKSDSDERPKENDARSKTDGSPSEMECNLVIDEGVVEKIAFLATNNLDGIVEMKGNVLSMIQEGFGGNDRRKGTDADIDEGGAAISLSLVLKYGTSAIDLFDKIREIVTKNVKDMTGLEVRALTINVVDVMDDDEIAERNGNAEPEQTPQKTYTRRVA